MGMVFAGPAHAQVPTSDCAFGQAEADLDVGNVRARLYNNGHLFWSGEGNTYTVPKAGAADAIYASELWVGGLDENGQLRFAGATYGPFEYWPGPLNEEGLPPEDFAPHDRIYAITRADLDRYEQAGEITNDLRDWPACPSHFPC